MAAAVSRTDRRRRVLQDSGGATPVEASGNGKPAFDPSSAASYDRPDQSLSFLAAQTLAPQNAWLLAAGSIASVAALVGGVTLLDRLAGSPAAVGVSALDLGSPRSAAAWLESALLLAAGCGALIVYRMRRRRTDDFRGCYRWWLAAVVGLPIAAFCSGVGLHSDLAMLVGQRLGWTAEAARAASLIVPLALFFLPLAVRLGWQMRSAPLALTQLVGATAAFATGVAASLGLVPAAWSSIATYAAPLAGASLLIGCLAAFARRMTLEASGSVAARPSRKPKEESEKAERTAKPSVRIAPVGQAENAPAAKQAISVPAKKQPAASTADEESSKWVSGAEQDYRDDYEEGSEEGGRLSKAERKRLRRAQAEKRAA